MSAKIAIVGGGIAGASIAMYLGNLGLNVTLFEKKPTLVDGPPICHLHAGGNLYREISKLQCIRLLKESIELVQLYPCAVEYRPTVVAVPVQDEGLPEYLFERLEILKNEYSKLIHENVFNKLLGNVEDYYKVFDKAEIKRLSVMPIVEKPVSFEEWMIPVAKNIDMDTVKFPLIMVQEYGLNVFRLAASATLAFQNLPNVSILTNTTVNDVKKVQRNYKISYGDEDKNSNDTFDFLINAAGFRSGEIDDMLGFHKDRFVEFKAAYVTQWENKATWPEVIFYGKRGTPNGMAQFTPYPDGYIQLHGMTQDITLFNDGLVKNDKSSAQPKLPQKYIKKIDFGWKQEEAQIRGELAVKYMSKYIPQFANATVYSKPLYGAQQIPGTDASLRAAEISFEGDNYARLEIVKASSVLSMADAITKKFIDLNILDASFYRTRNFEALRNYNESDVTFHAKLLCNQRGYPVSLAMRQNSSLMI